MSDGLKRVSLITDGACKGNPGPGGWAFILRYGDHAREGSGGEPHTTNNRMEIRAAIEGLKALKERCEVDITTDSEYLRQGITEWIKGWKRNNWMTKSKDPVKNSELWKELDSLCEHHVTHWHWTKGHANHRDNNRCDELATAAAERFRR